MRVTNDIVQQLRAAEYGVGAPIFRIGIRSPLNEKVFQGDEPIERPRHRGVRMDMNSTRRIVGLDSRRSPDARWNIDLRPVHPNRKVGLNVISRRWNVTWIRVECQPLLEVFKTKRRFALDAWPVWPFGNSQVFLASRSETYVKIDSLNKVPGYEPDSDRQTCSIRSRNPCDPSDS